LVLPAGGAGDDEAPADAPGEPDGAAEPDADGDGLGDGLGLGLGLGLALGDGLGLAAGLADAPELALAPGDPLAPGEPLAPADAEGAGEGTPASTPAICSVLIAMKPSPVVTAVASSPCDLKTASTWSGVTLGSWKRISHVVPPV
jgi:hypothetical protein